MTKKTLSFFLLLTFTFLLIGTVSAVDLCTQTWTIGRMNQTPNLTGGCPCDSSWNLSYYLRDTTRSLTGQAVYRDVNNDFLSLIGGDTGVPYGGSLQLYGGANPAMSGGAALVVGNAAGNAVVPVFTVQGRTDTPELNLGGNKIVDLADPTNAQDAVTLAYYNAHMGGGGGIVDTSWNISYFLTDASRVLQGALNAGNFTINNLSDPTSGMQAVTLNKLGTYVGNNSINGSYVPYWSPRPMQGLFDAGNFSIYNVTDPTSGKQAATMNYVLVQNGNITGLFSIVTNETQFYLLNGTRILRGRLDAGSYNLSNITTVALMDAVNLSYLQGNIINSSYDTVANNTNFFYKPGVPGGQWANGGILAGDTLTLNGTISNGLGNILLNGKFVGVNTSSPIKTFQVGNTLYVDNITGRIGINATSPSDTLAISTTQDGGGLSLTELTPGNQVRLVITSLDNAIVPTASNPQVYISNLNTGSSAMTGIAFTLKNTAVSTAYILASKDSTATPNTALTFLTGSGTKPSERIRIDGNGNLGIGTTSPNATFENMGTTFLHNNLSMQGFNINNLSNPSSDQDAATRKFVDTTSANDKAYTNVNISAAAVNDTARVKGGIKRLSAIQSIFGTTATAITGLSFPIAAMETTQFDAWIQFGSMSLNGTQFSVTIPSGAINASMFCPVVKTGIPSTFNQSLIVASATLTGDTCNHEADQRGWVQLTGTVQNAASAGTVQFNIANKRASTLVVNASSYVKWNRLDSYTTGGI